MSREVRKKARNRKGWEGCNKINVTSERNSEIPEKTAGNCYFHRRYLNFSLYFLGLKLPFLLFLNFV